MQSYKNITETKKKKQDSLCPASQIFIESIAYF